MTPAAGLIPGPELRRQRTWSAFIEEHRSVIWTTDFLTVDTITGCFYILFFINPRTRRVVLGGITDHPREAWMRQVARNMTDAFDEPLDDARYLIHDRDRSRSAARRPEEQLHRRERPTGAATSPVPSTTSSRRSASSRSGFPPDHPT